MSRSSWAQFRSIVARSIPQHSRIDLPASLSPAPSRSKPISLLNSDGAGILHPLPFTTFGEIAALGLEVHVSCSRCYEPRRIAFADDRLLARPFAGTRFCCAKTRRNGETGGGLGTVYVRPTEMLQVGGPVSLPSCSAEDACRTGRSTRSSSTSHHGRTQTCSAATASVARGVEGRSRGTYTGRLGGRPMAVPPRHPPGAQHTKWWNSVAVYPLPQHGNIGGRNGSCRTAVAFGYSHSHSLAHVGAGLAALGAEPTRLRDSACFQIIRSA